MLVRWLPFLSFPAHELLHVDGEILVKYQDSSISQHLFFCSHFLFIVWLSDRWMCYCCSFLSNYDVQRLAVCLQYIGLVGEEYSMFIPFTCQGYCARKKVNRYLTNYHPLDELCYALHAWALVQYFLEPVGLRWGLGSALAHESEWRFYFSAPVLGLFCTIKFIFPILRPVVQASISFCSTIWQILDGTGMSVNLAISGKMFFTSPPIFPGSLPVRYLTAYGPGCQMGWMDDSQKNYRM